MNDKPGLKAYAPAGWTCPPHLAIPGTGPIFVPIDWNNTNGMRVTGATGSTEPMPNPWRGVSGPTGAERPEIELPAFNIIGLIRQRDESRAEVIALRHELTALRAKLDGRDASLLRATGKKP